WGGGRARLTALQRRAAGARPVARASAGDAVPSRVHYEAQEPVTEPVFSFSVHTPDGVLVSGPNTKEAEVWVDEVHGTGHVDLQVPRLLLLLGNYDLSAECTNKTVTHSYDRLFRAFRFDVKPGTPHETYGGMTSLDGRFTIARD